MILPKVVSLKLEILENSTRSKLIFNYSKKLELKILDEYSTMVSSFALKLARIGFSKLELARTRKFPTRPRTIRKGKTF